MNNSQALQILLEQNPVFSELNIEQKRLLGDVVQEITLDAGDTLMEEGEKADHFFMIIEGQLGIMKQGQESQQDYQITALKAGEVVGELALIDNQKRSATVRALERTTLAAIDIKALQSNSQMLAIHSILVKNIARSLAKRLRSGNTAIISGLERELNQAKARIALGLFTVNTLILASLYTLNIGIISQLSHQAESSTMISAPIILIFAVLFLLFMLRSAYPLETYGITTKDWKKSIIESTLFTLPILAGFLLIKFIVFYPEIMNHEMSIFGIVNTLHNNPETIRETLVFALIYIFFCPLQELVARGGLQASLYNFLVGSVKRRQWIAILVSNLIFAQAHIHLSMMFALSAFLPGLFWGWLFSRQKNLLGCSWSHILIGVVGLFIIGFK